MAKKTSARESEPKPNNTTKPAATIRHGNLKCVVWRNESDKGPWYVADLLRTFKSESGFQETSKVNGDDLLRVAFLATQAYAQVLELKAQDKADRQEGPDEPHY